MLSGFMMEFYPIHFYGQEFLKDTDALTFSLDKETVVALTFSLDKEKKVMRMYDGIEWKPIRVPESYYYYERDREDRGKIYLVTKEKISDICEEVVYEENVMVCFQERDVIVDTIHGNFLQMTDGYWYKKMTVKMDEKNQNF